MHDFLDFLKSQGQNGFHTPEQKDAALNAASMDKFLEERKLFESTSYTSDCLHAFKTFASITMVSGLGDLPEDYSLRTNASASNDTIKVTIVPESEWVEAINDPIDTPSTTKPIIAIRTQVQVYPASVTPIKLYYLRKPATMVFGYTDDDGDLIYSSGTSTQCDWPEEVHIDIIRRSAVYLGIPIDDTMMIKLESLKKQTENA